MDRRTAAQLALREIVGPRLADDPLKRSLDRLARQLGFGFSRTYEIWYGRVPDQNLSPAETSQIADALEKKRRMAARNELTELRGRISRLEAMLSRIDPDFHCETVAALRNSTLRTD